jgi:hypothetical protein
MPVVICACTPLATAAQAFLDEFKNLRTATRDRSASILTSRNEKALASRRDLIQPAISMFRLGASRTGEFDGRDHKTAMVLLGIVWS